MAEKTLGYVELDWTCKKCGTKNPGTVKICVSCGSPMAESDGFEIPAEQILIQVKEKLAEAGRGADLICPFCGTRNSAGSNTCTQCGGDLKSSQARQQGAVLGAFQSKPAPDVACPSCGALNSASLPRCNSCGASLAKEQPTLILDKTPEKAKDQKNSGLKIGIAIAALVALLCAGVFAFIFLANKSTTTPAVVQEVQWRRSIEIMEQRLVEHEDWKDQIPSGAPVGACTEKVRKVQSDPAPGAEEVCGTPYTVDQGNGTGKVVQDCEYKVYDHWCSYSLEEWQVVNTLMAQGTDSNPVWPNSSLQSDQREGSRNENYAIIFRNDQQGQTYTYGVSDSSQFSQYPIGSRWNLDINTFGQIMKVQPK